MSEYTSSCLNLRITLLALQIRITVEDVNDNSPVFSNPTVTINLHEGEDIEQVFLTVSASDADAGSNGEIRYGLQGGEGT